jgi:hypothetical protein
MKNFVVTPEWVECELTILGENLTTIKIDGAKNIFVVDRGSDYVIYDFLIKKLPISDLMTLSQEYCDIVFQLVYYESDKTIKVIFENGISFEFSED